MILLIGVLIILIFSIELSAVSGANCFVISSYIHEHYFFCRIDDWVRACAYRHFWFCIVNANEDFLAVFAVDRSLIACEVYLALGVCELFTVLTIVTSETFHARE